MTLDALAWGAVAGFAATWTMDQLARLSRWLGWIAGVDRRWMGRWFLGLLRGRLRHEDIRQSPERPGEQRAARLGHYLIGITLGVLYAACANGLGLLPSAWHLALGYGFLTNVFPWLLMFPAMGFGPLGLRGPARSRLLASSCAAHLYYGIGLWWTASLLPLS